MPQEVTLRIAVVSSDASFRATVAEVLGLYPDLATVVSDTPTAAASLNAGTIDRLQTENAEVVIIDLNGDPAGGMRMLRLLGDAAPNRTVIATGPALTPDLLIEGMRAGIAEYLPSPVDSHDLADALRRAGRRLGRGYSQASAGRLFTFIGAKGGTGVTTAAANAALALHKHAQRTLLLDLNLEGGNLALAMGLRPRYSVADLLENFHRVDESLLSSLVATHGSGVEVLAAPLLPESMPVVSIDQARAVLRLLRRHYDLVVVDLGRPYSDFGRAALEGADATFLMLVPDVLAIHGAKRLMPMIRKGLESRSGRVEVVLNRVTPEDEVQKHDVEEALDIKHVHVLRRDDATMVSAVNVGQPVCMNGRKSRYAKDMTSLCAAVDASSATSSGKQTGMRRLFRGLVPDRTKPEMKA
jgi:pilus assembly protein CpaE